MPASCRARNPLKNRPHQEIVKLLLFPTHTDYGPLPHTGHSLETDTKFHCLSCHASTDSASSSAFVCRGGGHGRPSRMLSEGPSWPPSKLSPAPPGQACLQSEIWTTLIGRLGESPFSTVHWGHVGMGLCARYRNMKLTSQVCVRRYALAMIRPASNSISLGILRRVDRCNSTTALRPEAFPGVFLYGAMVAAQGAPTL